MRKFLSVLLAVMMVVSTVSFAAPSVVNVTESATNAVAENATVVTTDETAGFYAESDYGTLVYSVDFERSDFDVTKFSEAYASLKNNPTAAYLNPDFNFSNVTTYTNAAGDGFSNAALVTENGNTYIQGNVTIDNSVYDGFFRMSKYTNPWPKGQYTFSVDVKVPAGQADGFTAQCNDTGIALTTISDFDTTKGDWQTVVYQTTNVVSGDNAVDGGIYGFFVTPKNVADGTVAYDNWKVYYKAPTATITIDPNGRAGKTAVDVEDLTANSNVSVSTLLAKAQEMDSAVIGLATEPAGAVINTSTHYVEYYDRLYAVYGFDVTIVNNGNSAVSNVAVNDVDTRNGITVSELVSRINNTSSKILRGISNTATGEPLADSYVVKSDSDVTLYMIWEADGSEYGTLLASIDFENVSVGTVLTDNAKVELVDPDALTNGEFLINWQVGGNTVAQEANSNKYVRGGQGWAQFIFNNPMYNDANAPMPEGKYTILASVIDFGTTTRSVNATCQKYNNVTAATERSILDSFTGENNKWDLVVGQWNGSSNDMTIFFTDGATTDVGFDNIRLYFEPASNAVFSITVDPNGRTDASSEVAKVNNGSTITAGELANLMPSGCVGVSLTANGEALPSDYIISPDYNKTVYAVWEYEESEFGTLLFQIDFEKDGISLPADKSTIPVKDIATVYNKDLVFGDNILFSAGKQSGSTPLDNREIVEENGNKYFRADFSDLEGFQYYTFFTIFEQESKVDWMDGTYTLVADFKTEKTYTGFSCQVNNKNEDDDPNLSVLDKETHNVDVWDTVAMQYAGAISAIDYGNGPTGNLYFAPRISNDDSYVAGKISVDNIKLFFKTDETVITLKPNGNSDISDIKVPVSTSTGITVAELIEEANQYPTTHTLLGISDSGSGELLAEDTLIKPSYQETYYLIWQTAANDPTISMQYGKLLFNIDFEKDSLLESGWDGQLSLDNNKYTSGSFPSYIASYYDEDIFTGKNFRIKFLTSDTETNASIKTDASGNNYLSGTPSTRWPQIVISNNDKLNIGAGYYTVFFDSYSKTGMTASMRIDKPTGSTILEGGNAANTAFSVPNDEWKSYSFKFELAEGDIFPETVVNYSLEPSDKDSATVGWDNLKVYFKPYEATVTILPGDYEEFGETTITGVDTTTATTLETVISSMMTDINLSGRGFAGLMDQYGQMVDLTKSVIIPCDMTYTIVWEEENVYAPVTWNSNSIRYSTKVNSRGIRFAADVNPTYALDSKTTEYGWVIARTDVLQNAGIRATSLTKESFGGDPKKVIVGKNYGFQSTGDDDADRKHFDQTDENIIITAVIYGVPEKYYGYAFTVRPYIVYDGVTYYGKPWSRSMFDTALSIKNDGYEACAGDQDLIDYVNDIINTVLENSNDIEFDYGEL